MAKLDINALRSERAEINRQVQALAAIEVSGAALSTEQLQQFDQLSARFKELGDQISRAEQAEQMAIAAAKPVDQMAGAGGNASPPVYAQPRTPEVAGAGVARMAMALIAAGGQPQYAAQVAQQRGYGDDVAMALSTATAGGGGVLVPNHLAAEVIELWRPQSVVRSLGARPVPLPGGNLTIPRLRGGAVADYIGSDSDIPVTDMSFDDLKLSAKKLSALVPISNDLLRFSEVSPRVDQMVVGDLTKTVAQREDKAFLRDNGSGNLPKGLRHWALPGNLIAASDGATLQKVETDLNKLILSLESVDAALTLPGWVMSPRTHRFLDSLRDGNGNKVYPELDKGLLKGYPYRKTTQIPNNLGVGGNESELYFADFGDCLIGETGQLSLDYSKEATYKDGNGEVVSAFQRDQTMIRVIVHHDFGPRHVESVAVLVGVKWGA